jgi:hypothetical protein
MSQDGRSTRRAFIGRAAAVAAIPAAAGIGIAI